MNRRCPHCGSTNVRRSGRLESEAGTYPFHSPYRCRDCDKRFWVVSRKTLFGVAAGGATFVIVVLVWSGVSMVARQGTTSPRSPSAQTQAETGTAVGSDVRELGDAWLRQRGTRLEGSTVGATQATQ
jgi:endogenous inhibitor of DNA gyrase (YacG/DUF329 family)